MKALVQESVRKALEHCFEDGSLTSGRVPAIVVEKPGQEDTGILLPTPPCFWRKPKRGPPVLSQRPLSPICKGQQRYFPALK